MNRKKILFFIDTLSGGGAEHALVNLVNSMDIHKYDITVLTVFNIGTNRKYLSYGIKYKYIFKKMFRCNVIIFRLFKPEYLYKRFIGERYDVAIAFLEGVTTRILSGCTYSDTKLIAWIHGSLNLKERIYPYRDYNECYNCYKKFDYIIGASQDVIDLFCSQMGRWGNIIVKHNIVKYDNICKMAMESVDDVKFDDGIPTLISVGRLVAVKAHIRLLHIHKDLISNGCIHRLYIIGEGRQRKKLERYINRNRLNDTVKLLGYKENPWKYISKADLFVCSSLSEGYSTVVIESLMLGVPVITTHCSGMNELLGGNNEYGVITGNNEKDLKEGIYRLISDQNLLCHYKTQAYIRGLILKEILSNCDIDDIL